VPDTSTAPRTRISLATATAIVIANMVGTGVFTSLGFQLLGLPAGFPVVMVWILGGILSFCGAVSYAELASMMPRSGGEYHLLSRAYRPWVGFLAGWISVTVGFSAPIAIAALGLGKYFSAAAGWGDPRLIATAVVFLVSAVHFLDVKAASRFQLAFTAGKVLLTLFLIVSALFVTAAPGLSFSPFERMEDGSAAWALLFEPAFATSLFWVMYSYAGWNAAVYVVDEIENPRRNVPLALMIGTGVVTFLYVALNVAFLRAAPIGDLKGNLEVGYIAAGHIFGANGGKIVGFLIAFGLVSTISSMIWAGPRVTKVMGDDYRPFRFLSAQNRSGAPSLAILIQGIIVLLLIWFVRRPGDDNVAGALENLLLYIQAILTVSSLLVVVAVFYLRWKQPDAERRYRAWGYPVTPALFALISVYMLWVFVEMHPAESAWGLLTLAAGLGVYWFCRKSSKA